MRNVNYQFAGEAGHDSPALIYYEDIIRVNIQKSIAIAGGAERMWPHVKTFKMAAVVELLQSYGIRRFKCATIAEAEMCARAGAPDILISYPLVGPAVDRFVGLNRQYRDSCFWAVGDNIDQIALLGNAGKAAGFEIPLLADVNAGMNRTGVSFESLPEFCRRAAQIPGLSLKGFHCYDGHLGIKDPAEREKAVIEETRRLMVVKEVLEAEGRKLIVLVLGGTPTFPCHAKNAGAFLSPGTCFIHDYGYTAKYKDLEFTPGACILTRVVSRPGGDLFTLDLGYKAISTDQEGPRGIITELPDAKPVTHSEEHWVFSAGDREPPPIGRALHVIPAHICPTTALYPGATVVKDGKPVNYWETTARSRKLSV
jgi:D-serine deaminase-like pyridoxal phosphate-dependent protein